MIIDTPHGQVSGRAVRASGKETGVVLTGGSVRGEVQRIRVIGREEQTNPERARDAFVLSALQGSIQSIAHSSPFIRALWFSSSIFMPRAVSSVVEGSSPAFMSLNTSQKNVVRAMLSEDESIVVVHGASQGPLVGKKD